MKAYKLKDKIIRQVTDEILSEYRDYDFFDITLTPEFHAIEKIVSLFVDKISSGTLEKNAYVKYCEHCDDKLASEGE